MTTKKEKNLGQIPVPTSIRLTPNQKAKIYRKYQTIQNFINIAIVDAFRRKKK